VLRHGDVAAYQGLLSLQNSGRLPFLRYGRAATPNDEIRSILVCHRHPVAARFIKSGKRATRDTHRNRSEIVPRQVETNLAGSKPKTGCPLGHFWNLNVDTGSQQDELAAMKLQFGFGSFGHADAAVRP